ncbi:DNA-binding transcriptional regulator, LysR family [Paraburkholderia phenazinium]|jgi:DNA-binding transcriptional LysR family regulator|uniref:DNA-binding transcriptional regulator, LysR family n=1 Tax=Paraburkholderia phenazinium TaxID=60549 RepID=A0A1G8BVW8_9BURK|nr:LysR family transcriptional regulator [Paraburkholderia phenazinium]SDH37258.1 DNA-binding transcriptional regulator, LysR family [Paraburkholderia phenazinium]
MNHLQSMRVFVKVAELGSFARTAGVMGISTAVVTRHVADLEERLGTRLLNRTTRSQSLTESGRVYLERVRPILDDLEGVEQMVVARNHEPVGTLRIVAPVVFGLHNFAPVLQSYAQRYPEVIPDVTLVDRHVDLVEEGFDVGVLIARQMRSASIVTRRLTTGHMTVCATPEYLQTHGRPNRPEDLQDHPSLSLPAEYGGDERVFTCADGSEVRVRPTNAIVANNTEMLRQFALLGMGVAILPSYLIGRDLERGKLVRLLDDYRLPQVEVTIAYPSRHHLPAKVRTFIDHLVEHFSRMAPYLPGDAAATPAAAARVAQAKRAVAERALALPEFDDLDEAALVARGTVTVASAATAATQGARKVSRSARMAEPLSAGLQG